MKVPIWDGKYRIESDARCYRLIEIKTKKSEDDEDREDVVETEDGIIESTVGYYNTIEYLITSLLEREKRLNKCTTLEGYAKHIKKVNQQAAEIIGVLVDSTGSKAVVKQIMEHSPMFVDEKTKKKIIESPEKKVKKVKKK